MPDRGRPQLHFLRIGKTGSTALQAALAPVRDGGECSWRLVFHGHRTRLADVPPGVTAFFALRDPLARLVSGFGSRRRQGRPRYDIPWKEGEARSFRWFATPQELGDALASSDPVQRERARYALEHIAHVNRQYDYWLGDAEHLAARADDLLFVLRQETLGDELPQLAGLLGLDAVPRLPDDPVAAHRSPVDPRMTTVEGPGRDALVRWLAPSYALLAQCEQLRADRGWGAQPGVP